MQPRKIHAEARKVGVVWLLVMALIYGGVFAASIENKSPGTSSGSAGTTIETGINYAATTNTSVLNLIEAGGTELTASDSPTGTKNITVTSNVTLTGQSGLNVNGVDGIAQKGTVFTLTPTYGASAADVAGTGSSGVANTFSRGDHVHKGVFSTEGRNGITVNGVGSLAASGTITVTPTYAAVASITTPGTSAAAGSADTAARGDHQHPGPAGGVNLGATAAKVGYRINQGTNITVTDSTTSGTHDVTITSTSGSGNVTLTGANGTTVNGVTTAQTGTTFTITPTYSGTVTNVAAVAVVGVADTASRGDHVHKGVLEAQGQSGITVNGADSTNASGSITITPTYSNTVNDIAGTGSVGAFNTFSRGDHVHKGVFSLEGRNGTTVNGLGSTPASGTLTVTPTYANTAETAAVSTASNNGTADRSSRADHVHQGVSQAIGLNGVTVNGIGGSGQSGSVNVTISYAPVGTIAALATAAAAGSSDTAARGDHAHAGPGGGINLGATAAKTAFRFNQGTNVTIADSTTSGTHDVTITAATQTSSVTLTGANGITVNGVTTAQTGSTFTITPTYSGTVTDVAAVAVVGSADTASRGDHVHKGVLQAQGQSGISVNGMESTNASGTITITPTYSSTVNDVAGTGSVGTFSTFSRGDHAHKGVFSLEGRNGTTVNGVGSTAASGTLTVTQTYSGTVTDVAATGVVGVADTAARGDHVHKGVFSAEGGNGITVNGTGAVAASGTLTVTPTYALVAAITSPGTSAAAGSADTFARGDHQHPGPGGGINQGATAAKSAFRFNGGTNITITDSTVGGTHDVTLTAAATSSVTLTGANGITVNGVTTAQTGSTFTITPTYAPVATIAALATAAAAGSSDTAARGDHAHAAPSVTVDNVARGATTTLLVNGPGMLTSTTSSGSTNVTISHPFGDAVTLNVSRTDTDIVKITAGCLVTQNTTDTRTIVNVDVSPSKATAGPLANGRDQSGAFSNNVWVYGYVITGANQTPAGLWSLSATAPTMPSNYTHWVLVTMANTRTSGFIEYVQHGQEIQYPALSDTVIISASAATSITSLDLSSLVPPSSRIVQLYTDSTPSVTAGFLEFYGDTRARISYDLYTQVVSKTINGVFWTPCSATQTVHYLASQSNMTIELFVTGFKW